MDSSSHRQAQHGGPDPHADEAGPAAADAIIRTSDYVGPDRRQGGRRQSVIDRRSTSRTLRKAQAFIDLEDLAEELAETDPPPAQATPGTGLERRRGPGRRRSDFTKAAEEGEMTREQFLFVMAIDAFKRSNNVAFPTWTDVLEVLRLLGYRKTLPCTLNLPSAEDWLERPDAPAGVREGATHLTRGEPDRDVGEAA